MSIKVVIPEASPHLTESYDREVRKIEKELLIKTVGDTVLIDSDSLEQIASDVGKFERYTFIVPGRLLCYSSSPSRVNKVLCYIITLSRKLALDLIIIAPSLKSIDMRVRFRVDQVMLWGQTKWMNYPGEEF